METKFPTLKAASTVSDSWFAKLGSTAEKFGSA